MSSLLINAEAYIFDFNGTLILDEKENREAWKEAVFQMRGKPQTDDEFALLNGRTDRETILYYFPQAEDDEIIKWIEIKESFYKKLCMEDGIQLASGAEALLSHLHKEGKPMAIASSAPKINMDWYIPYFGLERFFRREHIIAGRDDIPSKPDGAIFRAAAESLGMKTEEAIVFEDSVSGVKAASDAKAKTIYRVGKEGKEAFASLPVIFIDSFSDLAY